MKIDRNAITFQNTFKTSKFYSRILYLKTFSEETELETPKHLAVCSDILVAGEPP